MSGWNVAQINIGRLLGPQGDPRVQPFFDALDEINALADQSAGFVWRLQGDNGNATALQATPDPLMIVNMSVWTDVDLLFDFVYRSAHTPVMARRREWVAPYAGAYQALWWVPDDSIPSVSDGLSRLWLLEHFGPSPQTFTFKVRYPKPSETGPIVDMQPEPWCMGRA